MQLNKRKIINDPVFGFINIPSDFIYDLIQHPDFQRLQRIKQLGLTSTVYPGTTHTRFQHSIGAMHLMSEAIAQLRSKDNEITDEEAEAALAAILLHDIGHGPFSHALEHSLMQNISHEVLSLLIIEKINKELNGKLDMAIAIFKNEYPKKYLHQLISGQLDMDRLDYLRRDSFYSGVAEGTVGAARIIKMLNVSDDNLVVEAKGIYSIENFLISRRLMYWQVYLHKTAVAAEKMLLHILFRAKELTAQGENLFATPALSYFLHHSVSLDELKTNEQILEHFLLLDDSDIISAIKTWMSHPDFILSTLSKQFTNRKLFKVKISDTSFDTSIESELTEKYRKAFNLSEEEARYFFSVGPITNDTYNPTFNNILILYKDGATREISEASDILNSNMLANTDTKYLLCYSEV